MRPEKRTDKHPKRTRAKLRGRWFQRTGGYRRCGVRPWYDDEVCITVGEVSAYRTLKHARKIAAYISGLCDQQQEAAQ